MAMSPEQMEQLLREHTSSLKMLDNILKAAKIGQPKTLAFRCSHSGLYYPPDYTKEWGHKYGIGLGPEPVSECLNTNYLSVLPPLEKVKRPEQLAFSVDSTQAQVDLVEIPEEDLQALGLILAIDDPDVERRMEVILPKQLEKSPILKAMHADFGRRKGVR